MVKSAQTCFIIEAGILNNGGHVGLFARHVFAYRFFADVLLVAEMAIEVARRHAARFGDVADVGFAIAVMRKEFDGMTQNLATCIVLVFNVFTHQNTAKVARRK